MLGEKGGERRDQIDRKAANHPGDIMRWANKVSNRAEGKRVIAGWARLLRDRLDEIHGKGGDAK